MVSALFRSRTYASRLGLLASLAATFATLNGCDGDNYYPGEPLANATIALATFNLPESASTARIAYTARWRILDDDFRRYPYLLELKNTSTGQHIDLHPASSADSATGTFACADSKCDPGRFAATVFAELEKGKLLAVGYTYARVSR